MEKSETETPTWHERSVLRSAKRAASLGPGVRVVWYVALAAFLGWYLWDGVAVWNADRAAAHQEFVKAFLFGAGALLAIELDATLRLLARFALAEGVPEASALLADGGKGAEASGRPVLAESEVRRLARAASYADRLEQLRWLHPIMTAVAVGSAVAALALVEIPRPLDLVVAGLVGLSVAAAIAVAALRRWVRLAAGLARSRASKG